MYYVAIYDGGKLLEQYLVKDRENLDGMVARFKGSGFILAAWQLGMTPKTQIQSLPIPPEIFG